VHPCLVQYAESDQTSAREVNRSSWLQISNAMPLRDNSTPMAWVQ